MFAAAKLYQFELEDLRMAIETYENLHRRFPKFKKTDELYYNLYLCYKKNGDEQKAASIIKLLNDGYPTSNYTGNINNPDKKLSNNPNTEATKAYTIIYNLFLEGNFEKALELKKLADTQFGSGNWTQQLLYIEAVYYLKQKNDSLAIITLTNLVNLNATSALGIKANNLIDVVKRRAAIESELQHLQITRLADDTIARVSNPVIKPVTNPVTNPVTVNPPVTVPKNPKDTLKTVPVIKPSKFPYKADSLSSQYVGVVLVKVDNIFANEARNSFVIYNRGSGRTLQVNPVVIDSDNRILLIGNFSNANDAFGYLKNTQAKAARRIRTFKIIKLSLMKPFRVSFSKF
jgi:tetratricopeptide (TPR) repeat protein